jgi:hypothetical protein
MLPQTAQKTKIAYKGFLKKLFYYHTLIVTRDLKQVGEGIEIPVETFFWVISL